MEKITKHDLVQQALHQFDDQPTSQHPVKDLPADATADQIAAAYGHRIYEKNCCDECGNDVDALVKLGEEPGIESSTANICKACLIKALELLERGD